MNEWRLVWRFSPLWGVWVPVLRRVDAETWSEWQEYRRKLEMTPEARHEAGLRGEFKAWSFEGHSYFWVAGGLLKIRERSLAERTFGLLKDGGA